MCAKLIFEGTKKIDKSLDGFIRLNKVKNQYENYQKWILS